MPLCDLGAVSRRMMRQYVPGFLYIVKNTPKRHITNPQQTRVPCGEGLHRKRYIRTLIKLRLTFNLPDGIGYKKKAHEKC